MSGHTNWNELRKVGKAKSRFRARTRHNKIIYHIGYFNSQQEAREAVKKYREEKGWQAREPEYLKSDLGGHG